MRIVFFIVGLTSLVLLFLYTSYLVQQKNLSKINNQATPTAPPQANNQDNLVETVASSYRNPFDTIIAQETSESAEIAYPITQLGNCKDAQECYTYCLIPRNTPACWSYGTFVLNIQVLGISSSAETNEEKFMSCNADPECRSYCQQNPDRCFGYSSTENNYLGPSGCRNEEECQSFCKDHPSFCPGFQIPQPTARPTNPPSTENPQEGVACTQEAKLCPDGSYVGRTGPNCEFSPCP